MIVGYARVSTEEQRLDMQVEALRTLGCNRIYEDHGCSGSRFDRDGLDAALASLKPGGTLIVWRLDRLGRSLSGLVDLIDRLGKSSVHFRSVMENIDTSSPGGRLMFHMMAALAEFERAVISERTRAGLAQARARGAALGRPKALQANQLEQVLQAMHFYNANIRKVAERFDVSERTLRRYLGQFAGKLQSEIQPMLPPWLPGHRASIDNSDNLPAELAVNYRAPGHERELVTPFDDSELAIGELESAGERSRQGFSIDYRPEPQLFFYRELCADPSDLALLKGSDQVASIANGPVLLPSSIPSFNQSLLSPYHGLTHIAAETVIGEFGGVGSDETPVEPSGTVRRDLPLEIEIGEKTEIGAATTSVVIGGPCREIVGDTPRICVDALSDTDATQSLKAPHVRLNKTFLISTWDFSVEASLLDVQARPVDAVFGHSGDRLIYRAAELR